MRKITTILLTVLLVVCMAACLSACKKTEEKLLSLDEQIAAINTSINELKTIDEQIKQSIAELEAKANSTEERIEGIDEVIAELKAKDAELESRIAALESAAKALTDRVSKNEEDITDINGSVDEILKRLETIDALNKALQTRIDCLEGKHSWDFDDEGSGYYWANGLVSCHANLKCANCSQYIRIESQEITYDNYVLTATFPESTHVPAKTFDITDVRGFDNDTVRAVVKLMLSSGTAESAEVRLTLSAVPLYENVFQVISETIRDYDGFGYNGPQNGAVKLTIAGVETISDEAFRQSDWLGELVIGEGVKTIGTNAFNWCTYLKSVSIANDLETIGRYAFECCTGLTNVSLDEKLREIGEYAFNTCESLKTLNIPNGVTSIGDYAFNECRLLESITFGSGITEWNCWLDNCSELTSITFTAPLEVVEPHALDLFETRNITLTLVDGQMDFEQSVDNWVAKEDQLFEVNGDNVFCEHEFKSIVLSVSIDATKMNADEIQFAIEQAVMTGKLNISIALASTASTDEFAAIRTALAGTKDLITLSISGATEIPQDAFRQLSNLKRITIGDGVTSIGRYAFANCDALVDVHIGKNVSTIGEFAFDNCGELQSVNIPLSVTSIGASAFNTFVLADVYYAGELENWIKILFETAYSNPCSSGAKLYFNGKLVERVTISDVTNVPDSLFYGCASLTSVTIEEGVTSIGVGAFGICTSLAQITIPSSVTHIGDGAFECTAITDITLSDNVTELGANVFNGCDKLESVVIGSGVTDLVCVQLFRFCYSLQNITFKAPITRMLVNTFMDCNTENITLTFAKGQKELVQVYEGDWEAGEQMFGGGNEFCGLTFDRINVPIVLDASGMTADELEDALAQVVQNGSEDITVQFDSTTTEQHWGAIVNALYYVNSGSIKLTIDGVWTISGAFYNCEAIKSLTIENVSTIAWGTVRECHHLNSITIGKGVTKIDNQAFLRCSQLTTVIFEGTIEEWNAIEKGDSWLDGCAGYEVVCSDGSVSIW